MAEQEKTFLSAPSAEDLRPTPEEQFYLRELWDWGAQSKRSMERDPRPVCVNCDVLWKDK